jgi:hypothetical protein
MATEAELTRALAAAVRDLVALYTHEAARGRAASDVYPYAIEHAVRDVARLLADDAPPTRAAPPALPRHVAPAWALPAAAVVALVAVVLRPRGR